MEQFDNICEVQSDKASVTITSRYDGKIVKLHHNVDDMALVGKPLVDFDVVEEEDEEGESDSSTSSSSSSESDAEVPKSSKKENCPGIAAATAEEITRHITLATPAVRRIAMENKVNLSKVPPTGKNGRVLKGDVLEYLGQIPSGTNVPHPTIAIKAAAAAAKGTTSVPSDRTEQIKGVRRAMLKSMTETLVR